MPQAIRCFLRQDYPNLEIVICDNASTDATPEICARAADHDPRAGAAERHLLGLAGVEQDRLVGRLQCNAQRASGVRPLPCIADLPHAVELVVAVERPAMVEARQQRLAVRLDGEGRLVSAFREQLPAAVQQDVVDVCARAAVGAAGAFLLALQARNGTASTDLGSTGILGPARIFSSSGLVASPTITTPAYEVSPPSNSL